ncbi:replication-relaxation family protein [Couchioplanes caeruleus]|nr:replication-relaxation family protein [Couchioplanes caeruleus]
MAGELTRLTPRDRHLLDLLDQHKTLTTDQLVDVAFGSAGRARNRLNVLLSRDILDRFRHYQRPGSQSWRWTLGPVGAALVAAGRGDPLPRPATVRDATARLAMSPTLPHLLAVNGFFVALTAHARTDPSTRLDRWWNEARCREEVGTVVRPDGHGVWNVGGRAVPFWLEVDLGTETLSRVVGKLDGYAKLPPPRAYPVLFVLPIAAREANLHAHLSRTGVPDGLTVATAADDHAADTGGPAGPVWRVTGRPGRVSLADLAPAGDGAVWDG